METPYVNIEIKNAVGIIEFFHPKGNSMPSSQLEKLTTAFNTLDTDPAVNIILLRSKGERIFCAGASFDELQAIDSLKKGKDFFMGFAHVMNAMQECRKIIVGCIEGKSVGGGVGIASACDYTFASSNSSIKLSELSIGIGPFVIEPFVRRKIGLNAFTELTLNPTQWRLAKWGKKKGIFNKIVKDPLKESLIFAQTLSRYNLEALSEIKKILWKDHPNITEVLEARAATSGHLVLSKFTQGKLAEFKPSKHN